MPSKSRMTPCPKMVPGNKSGPSRKAFGFRLLREQTREWDGTIGRPGTSASRAWSHQILRPDQEVSPWHQPPPDLYPLLAPAERLRRPILVSAEIRRSDSGNAADRVRHQRWLNLDWLICSETNLMKFLEGQYREEKATHDPLGRRSSFAREGKFRDAKFK